MENTNTVMGTMEHHTTVFGPQQHYDHHNSNNILLGQPQPGSKCSSECWAPTSKGVYQLNSPEIPSHRISADELSVLQPKLILTYTYKRTQAGSPGIENNIELKWLAPGTQRFVHSRP